MCLLFKVFAAVESAVSGETLVCQNCATVHTNQTFAVPRFVKNLR